MEVYRNGVIYTIENNNFLKKKDLIESSKFLIAASTAKAGCSSEAAEAETYKEFYRRFLHCEYSEADDSDAKK